MALFSYIAFKCDTLYQLHDDKMQITLIYNVIDIYNIRMGQRSCCLCLHFKLSNKSGIRIEFRFQYLDCHQTVQLVAFCLINI